MHWSYGSNMAGYLPDSEATCVDDWAEARFGLREDLQRELDDLGTCYEPEDAETAARLCEQERSLTEAIDALDALDSGATFCAYVSDGGAHTIPTAYWLESCEDDAPREPAGDSQSWA